jgi:predicted nucleic acid-binding protein
VIQLDTSFLIRALVRSSPEDALLRKWLLSGKSLAVSAIAWAEFLCGPLEPEQIQLAGRVVGEVLPFSVEDAAMAAELFNHSGRRRGSLADCMVAASALLRDAELATANPSDLLRLEASGLRILDG